MTGGDGLAVGDNGLAVGIDGFRDGWVAARLGGPDGRAVSWLVTTHISDVLRAWPGLPTGVDMPVGTQERGARAADLAARHFLRDRGGPWQSVFLTPTRAVLADAHLGHAEAMRRARGRGEPGTSMQMWQLLPKIAQVDTVRGQVAEVHPECSFRELDPRVSASKKSARGAGQRIAALAGICDVVAALPEVPPGPGLDDALDAAVAAWSARRWGAGEAIRLGDADTAVWV